MRDVVTSESFPLADAVLGLIDANGKMLRPAFLLLASDFGRKPRDLTNLAASIELLHIATLIHDDVIDEAPARRGVPTIHTRYGVKDAVLAGDWLFSRCFRLASESSSPSNAVLLAGLVGAVCSEEIHQGMDRFRWPRSSRNYLRKIAGKTSALFSLALRAGAMETKATARVVASLTRIGYDVGMAFQIMDDVLDYDSSACAMRKPVANDVREGLCTLPLILALEKRDAELSPLLGADKPDDATVDRIVSIVRDCGATDDARKAAARYTGRARRELTLLPRSDARDALSRTVTRLLDRDC